MLSDSVKQERHIHCIDEVFFCPCSQSAKGTPLLMLLRDPYILVAAGKLTLPPFGRNDSRGQCWGLSFLSMAFINVYIPRLEVFFVTLCSQ